MNWESKYRTLGLTPEASWDEVKSAFRRLARLYHPDVAGPEGSQRFTEITQAYMDLKECMAPGARKTASHVSQTHPKGKTDGSPKESFWARIVQKFFSATSFWGYKVKASGKETVNDGEKTNPVRSRFIESILDRADSQLEHIFLQGRELKKKQHIGSITRRLNSRHPAVVLLALQHLTPAQLTKDISFSVLEHFKGVVPTSEVLAVLLSLFLHAPESEALAKTLSSQVCDYPSVDAHCFLRWLRRQDFKAEYLSCFLSHPDPAVVAAALSVWQAKDPPPSQIMLRNLLLREDEIILLPLLRFLRQRGIDPTMRGQIEKLAKQHQNSAVRVWAASIVRERELS